MVDKKALITGFTGQDGSYLAELLLEKGYDVYGLHRRISADPFKNVNNLLQNEKMHIIRGDVTDAHSMNKLIQNIKPDEIYNLAGQSFVEASWDQTGPTREINAWGPQNILEAIINKPIKFYQASTSEMFGSTNPPQNEGTIFHPRSPYAVSKTYGHFITQNYRESYNLFACSGILFNHESPRRGKEFVTRKISHSIAKIKLGLQEFFELGNLDAKRDWGYSKDYVEAMWLMLQQDKPEDYVIGTGESHSVKEFAEEAFKVVDMPIHWEGTGLNEVGKHNNKTVLKINQKFYRPAEVNFLLADPSKAKKNLGWEPKTKFKDLVKMMVESDLEHLTKYGLLEDDKSRLDINCKK